MPPSIVHPHLNMASGHSSSSEKKAMNKLRKKLKKQRRKLKKKIAKVTERHVKTEKKLNILLNRLEYIKCKEKHLGEMNQPDSHRQMPTMMESHENRSASEVMPGPALPEGNGTAAGCSSDSTVSRARAPMTKEEWDKQESVVRRVYDPLSGRDRFV